MEWIIGLALLWFIGLITDRPGTSGDSSRPDDAGVEVQRLEHEARIAALIKSIKTEHNTASERNVAKGGERVAGADVIQKFVEERQIKWLTHFTRVENLAGILEHGLLGRVAITGREIGGEFNDGLRLDGYAKSIRSINGVSKEIGRPENTFGT